MTSLRVLGLYLIGAAMIAGCATGNSSDEYELTLESCYDMQSDKEHPYWEQPIAVQGCEMLISEYEMKKTAQGN